MVRDGPVQVPAGIASRYPEKAYYLGQVFNDTTNSYKLFWFLGILSVLRRSDARGARLADLLNEMAVAAWHPVCLFRLSLGRQDKLQEAVTNLQRQSQLDPNARPDGIRDFLQGSAHAQRQLDPFRRYVPTRFLSPWFAENLRGIKDAQRGALIASLARKSQATPFASPYWFAGGDIHFNESWRAFLAENMAVVQAFAEHHLTLYLQARNPNVPGVVNKLSAPTERQLTAARRFWRLARTEFAKSGRSVHFRDIYSETELADDFAIDHFLPWSFVAHDQLWNLAPVERSTNSSKNDVLPDLDLYLPRMARLHFDAIQAASRHPKMIEDYTDCFKLDTAGLLALGEGDLTAKYREVMAPQSQIAINLGFQSGWRMGTATVVDIRPHLFAEEPGRDGGTARDSAEAMPTGTLNEATNTGKAVGRRPNRLPFYSLKAAAGGFLADGAPEPGDWVDVLKHGFNRHLNERMFVTKVLGQSMEPTIADGALCVFQHPVVCSRQGRILLVEKRDFRDPDTGGNYTVKRYRSTKVQDETGWRHESIELIPDNPDRARFPVLRFIQEDDEGLRVIAEFVEVLKPLETRSETTS